MVKFIADFELQLTKFTSCINMCSHNELINTQKDYIYVYVIDTVIYNYN
jgi:hypothetical protein